MNQMKRTDPATILIVEDEEDHARLITKTLRDSGDVNCELVHLKNGEEAIHYLKKEEEYKNDSNFLPALILLDIKMPMKNGFEVLRELKEDQLLKKIPVVMLSTSSNLDDLNKAMSLGANDYVVKPVKFSDFTSKIQKIGYYWQTISDSGKMYI